MHAPPFEAGLPALHDSRSLSVPASSPDLYGSAPDSSPAALLLIDVINDFEFEDGPQLLEQAEPAAERIAQLKQRARRAGVPVIYANDNFGRWQSSFEDVVARCTAPEARGRGVVETLKPGEEDYFILKPKQSAFYQTTLATLLDHLGTRTLVLTGITADICVLFTGVDAYMQGMNLIIPRDAVASVNPVHTDEALGYARRVLRARTPQAGEIDFERVVSEAEEGPAPRRREAERQEVRAT